MKKVFLTACACVGLILASITSAHALIINHDSYTTDTKSGLDWMDVTETTLLSYAYVSGQFGEGGEYDGWRYARSGELPVLVSNFYDHARMGSIDTNDYSSASPESLDPLIKMLGITGTNSGYTSTGRFNEYYTQGLLMGEGSDAEHLGGILKYSSINLNAPYSYSIFSDIEPDRRNIDIGSFLVRGTEYVSPEDKAVSVPEPASAMLMALGLISLLTFRRFK